ncbi:MAG: hypothetical protein V1853_00895 [bacterium]
MSIPANPPFRPINNGFGIQPMGPTPMGGGIHDTFRVDPYGNISSGHTTAQIPGGQKIHMPWNPGR